MAAPSDGIRKIPGNTNILIIAPHSPVIDGEFQNDIRTGIIAEEINRKLGCYTIINDRFFKPKGEVKKDARKYFLDLFRIDHSGKVPGYLDQIKNIACSDEKTLVIWVHGIADDVAMAQGREHIGRNLFSQPPEDLHALIGYGQGGDPKTGETNDNFSARPETVETLRKQLTAGGMTTVLTHPENSNFRGRDAKRLNQWFQQLGLDFNRAESIQLEIREKGFRDSTEHAVKAAGIIASALSSMV